MINLYDFDKKSVKIVCDNGRVFQGVAYVETDEETEKDCVLIRDGRLYEIYEDEIVRIEEIDSIKMEKSTNILDGKLSD